MATQYKRPCFLEGWVPADSQFKKARLSKCVPAPRPYRSRRVSSFVSRRRLKTWCIIYLCDTSRDNGFCVKPLELYMADLAGQGSRLWQ